MHTHYDILKISPSSSQEEISEAYEKAKRSILTFAPGVELSETDMASQFPLLWEACRVLGDPISRREYDLSLAVVLPEQQPEEIPLEESAPPNSMLRTVMGYSGFVLMMALFVFFLYYLAGYIL